MRIVLNDKDKFVLCFDRGEEVFAGLLKFMSEQGIQACVFFGLGACASVELGFYNGALKTYRSETILEELEVTSFSGNGAIIDDKPIIHAHGVFGRSDFTTIGGHVFKLTVSATCEIFLTKLEGVLERKMNTDLNLNTLV